MCRINYSELPLKEGEVLIENNHILSEINGDIVELKYCPHCKQWHPLSDFSIASNTSDGLQSWCTECQKEYRKQRYEEQKQMAQDESDFTDAPKQGTPIGFSGFDKAIEILSSIQQRDNEQQQEIERLQGEVTRLSSTKSVDLESLTEREIEKVLKANKIAPRLLFEAIARQDDRYTFYAVDNVTGLTSTIRLEKASA